MPNGEDAVKWFSKKYFFGSLPMAIRFYYISSIHNQVLRF